MDTKLNFFSQGTCCFCTDLKGQHRRFAATKEGFFNKACQETENFAAFPSLSPVGPGHSLIIPKEHYTSLAQVPSHRLNELLVFATNVSDLLQKRYGPLITFEHGILPGQSGGCGVTHAHLHLLAATPEVLEKAIFMIERDYKLEASESLGQFFLHSPQEPYFFIGAPRGAILCAHGIESPSQYLRRVIAIASGTTKWNWREYFNWDLFLDTQQVLSQKHFLNHRLESNRMIIHD